MSLCLIGSKGMTFFRRLDAKILGNVSGLGDRPHIKDLIGTVKVMLDAYKNGEIDRLFLVNAQFLNTMTQKPTIEQLLPVVRTDTEGLAEHWDYIYEPDAKTILDGLLMPLHRIAGVPRGLSRTSLPKWPRAWSPWGQPPTTPAT